MGYGYYDTIPRFDSCLPMNRGYGVICKCHKRGCKKEIDRGLAYLCYSCGWYFCPEHLFFADIEFECFAGKSGQVCEKCFKESTLLGEEE